MKIKEERMKHLPRVLFWAGIVSIPLSWLMWYFGPEIEIGRQVVNNIDDPTLSKSSFNGSSC